MSEQSRYLRQRLAPRSQLLFGLLRKGLLALCLYGLSVVSYMHDVEPEAAIDSVSHPE
jgi:hypothetical protein